MQRHRKSVVLLALSIGFLVPRCHPASVMPPPPAAPAPDASAATASGALWPRWREAQLPSTRVPLISASSASNASYRRAPRSGSGNLHGPPRPTSSSSASFVHDSPAQQQQQQQQQQHRSGNASSSTQTPRLKQRKRHGSSKRNALKQQQQQQQRPAADTTHLLLPLDDSATARTQEYQQRSGGGSKNKVYVFPAHSIIKSIISLTRTKREDTWTKYSALRDGRRRMFPALGNATSTISKNISLVLDNLLKNYESSQLPSHGKGHPTVVRTNMLIRSMGPFSELDMDYSMDCYFRQLWRDSRLSFSGPIKNLSLSIKMLERIWRPDTYFYNGKNSYVHTITVPNKLLRITQDGDILYSMRLTIKAKCLMELRKFPMDSQSCPLIFGSYAYTTQELVYQWTEGKSVDFVSGMALSQFDLMGSPKRNITFKRREGEFSVLQVNFNLQRHTGYFLIQVYVPCILIVVLSWVSFWIHREATSDRVGLGITTVLTLSTISLDSRTDLPKVRYATALDWFLLMSFFYCIATLLEFAAVHYFTKVGSGEIPMAEDDFEESDAAAVDEEEVMDSRNSPSTRGGGGGGGTRRRSSLICPIYNDPISYGLSRSSSPARQVGGGGGACATRITRHTQTERHVPKCRQLMYCLVGDDSYRRQRQREAAQSGKNHQRYVNSVSHIDRGARVLFPASFGLLNVLYWLAYYKYHEDFKWKEPHNPLK